MKFTFVYIELLSLILLSACVFNSKDCQKIGISQAEKAWLNFYSPNDTLIFKETDSKIDTIVVEKSINSFTTCNKFELGNDVYESSNVTLKLINKAKHENLGQDDIWIGLRKTWKNASNDKVLKNIKVFDFKASDFSDVSEIDSEKIFLQTTGIEYDSYIFDRRGTINNSDGSKADIVAFYWSKSDGLIKYVTADGKEFEFLKKY